MKKILLLETLKRQTSRSNLTHRTEGWIITKTKKGN